MLQEVLDSACDLTGAHYGGIATLADSGRLDRFFISGLTPGQRIELDTHEGLEIFERFRRMQEPLRSGDLAGHYRPTGVSGNRPGYADQLSQRARWELLSCQQAESGGVQPG